VERRAGPLPLHHLLFAAAFVLSAYVANSVSPWALFRPLIVAVAFAGLVWALAWLPLRSGQKAALVATGVVAILIFGRELAQIVANITGLLPAWQLAILGLAVGVALVLAVRLARRSLRRPGGVARWTSALNTVAVVLMVVILGTGATNGTMGQAIADFQQGVPLDAAPNRADVPRQGPDIYVILLDGHAREDVLAQRYDYDLEPFLAELEARGFEVARGSHSNYMFTQLTLTSMFHRSLLPVDALGPLVGGRPTNAAAREAVVHNPTFDFLRSQGYTTVAFGTPYENIAMRQADVFVEGPPLNEFEQHLINSTFVLDLFDLLAPDLMPGVERTAVNSVFRNLAMVAADHSLGPKFVWAHVMAPHVPFVFGPHGEPVDIPVTRVFQQYAGGMGLSQAEFERRFADQTHYADARTVEAIDDILGASQEPPIIIVMSDHGARSRPFDPATAGPDDLRERFGTLFAAYTPGENGVFPQDVTPAQIMVDLLNAYFGTDYPQPEKGTFASEISHPYDFTRVAEPPPPPD
jgi:hypothetical protein